MTRFDLAVRRRGHAMYGDAAPADLPDPNARPTHVRFD